jgi:hypothetical protein
LNKLPLTTARAATIAPPAMVELLSANALDETVTVVSE